MPRTTTRWRCPPQRWPEADPTGGSQRCHSLATTSCSMVGRMSSSSDRRSRPPAVRIAGVSLGVLGAVGGIAGWFTLAATADTTTSSLAQTDGTPAGEVSMIGQPSGPAHTRTGGS